MHKRKLIYAYNFYYNASASQYAHQQKPSLSQVKVKWKLLYCTKWNWQQLRQQILPNFKITNLISLNLSAIRETLNGRGESQCLSGLINTTAAACLSPSMSKKLLINLQFWNKKRKTHLHQAPKSQPAAQPKPIKDRCATKTNKSNEPLKQHGKPKQRN